MIIKFTIPEGFTKKAREKYGTKNILLIPEFLRDWMALYDNPYPSTIIVVADMSDSVNAEVALTFASLLKEGALKENI